MQQVNHILIHMSLIDGVGSQACAVVLRAFAQDIEHVYQLTARELHERTELSLLLCEKIINGLADKVILARELELIEKNNITYVTIADSDYPQLLRHIAVPPAVIYYRGPLEILSKTLAFVGSRKADTYGYQAIQNLIPDVVKEQFTTVSGGALGADGMIHRATIQAGGKTVAILGSGLLKPYPLSHKGLFEEIVYSGGLVMSAFPLMFDPLPGNFPARNRIIAGLCPATIVIQAARKSGALLTARNALDEGRDVGVVPGSIFNELSAGCHDLLTHGARSITSSTDIFELINYQPEHITIAPAMPTPAPTRKATPIQPAPKKITDPLLALCLTPKSMDELLLKAGLAYDALQDRLWQLQIDGRLEQNMLGMWHSKE